MKILQHLQNSTLQKSKRLYSPQGTEGDIARSTVSKNKSRGKNISKTIKKGKNVNNKTKEMELRYSN